MSGSRLLVFNSHEAWIHQLEGVADELDIVVDLPGRIHAGWDERMRPVPSGARLLSLEQALRARRRYDAVITHSVTDLLAAREIDGPKIIVLHTTLEGRVLEERSDVEPRQMAALLHQLLQLIGGHAVAVSELKGRSWSCQDDIVPFGVDPDAYLPPSLHEARGIRVSNQFNRRSRILLGSLHRAAFSDVPMHLVGHNPDIEGARAAENWQELKELLASHRFYVHTADPTLEDGYNMATLEAMAAGLPILGNRHPSSPIEHGVSGFLSDDPEALREFARELLGDRERALRMGKAAREVAVEKFHVKRFRAQFRTTIARARAKHKAHQR